MSADALWAKALTTCWSTLGLPPGSCIASARIAQAILKDVGVSSAPVPCAIWIGNEEAVDMLDSGLTDVALWPPSAYSVGVNPDFPPVNDHAGWNGHVILEGDGWIGDYSAAQFNRPAKRLKMGPWALRVGVEAKVTDAGWQLVNRRGTAVIIETRRELAAWRSTPDWRSEVPDDLVSQMAARTRNTLLEAVALADARKAASAAQKEEEHGVDAE